MKKGIFLMLFVCFISCSTPKYIYDTSIMLNLVIKDYYHTNFEYIDNYDYFEIENRTVSEKCYYHFSICPLINVYMPRLEDNSTLPTHYKTYKDKIFFYREKQNENVSAEMLVFLDSLGLVDSVFIKNLSGRDNDTNYPPPVIQHDGIKGVNYIICKDKPLKIRKKIKTSVYLYPNHDFLKRIKCNCE